LHLSSTWCGSVRDHYSFALHNSILLAVSILAAYLEWICLEVTTVLPSSNLLAVSIQAGALHNSILIAVPS
jgi:hypothetical protein